MQVQLWKYAKPAAGTGGALHAQTRGWTAQTVSPPRPTEQPKSSPSVELPSSAPMSVAFSGCGGFLAVGDGAQGGVRMWDAASLQKSMVQSPREGRVSCITWEQSHHASEQILACGTTAGSVHMYGVSVHGVPRLLHKQTVHRSSVVCFCFLRTQQENKLLSFDSDGHVVCTTWCAVFRTRVYSIRFQGLFKYYGGNSKHMLLSRSVAWSADIRWDNVAQCTATILHAGLQCSGCCITRRLQEVVVRSVAGVGDRW